jgi:hypothetical protein
MGARDTSHAMFGVLQLEALDDIGSEPNTPHECTV